MLVGSGIRNFVGLARSSLRNQPATITFVVVGLNNSIVSVCGGTVCVRTSLINTGAMAGAGSSAPGEPPTAVLARQAPGKEGSREKFARTRENPRPSDEIGHGGALL